MEPPAGFCAEGGGCGASNGAWVRQGAEGKVHLTKEAKILSATSWRGGANDLWRRDTSLPEPLPQGTGLTAAWPGVSVKTEEFNALGVPQCLAGELSQRVVEEEEHGQAAEVTKGATVHLPDAVVMEQETIKVNQATKHVLWEGANAVAMQKQLAQVDEVRKDVILQEMEIILLQQRSK